MKKVLGISLSLGIMFCSLGLIEKDIDFEVQVGKEEVQVGEVFKYLVKIEIKSNQMPKIEPPNFSNFKVVSQRISQRISYKQDKSIAMVDVEFLIAALKQGEFELPPVQVKQGSITLESPVKKVKVSGKVTGFKEEKKVPPEALKGAIEL